jgi:hypothetical protein
VFLAVDWEIRVMHRKLLPGPPRRRWKDNIKMELKEIAWNDMDRIHPA